MAQLVTRGRGATLTALCTLWSVAAAAQQRDTTAPPRPQDSLRVYTLPPAVVSVTRANPPINRIPQAVQLLDKTEISRARPTWGLDEALATVPGVYAANRYNFSLDQRISIRGFGARSAFAVRGIKVLVDGIPQTLPDGQGQLTNLELGAADRIERRDQHLDRPDRSADRPPGCARPVRDLRPRLESQLEQVAVEHVVPRRLGQRLGDGVAARLHGPAAALGCRFPQSEFAVAFPARPRLAIGR